MDINKEIEKLERILAVPDLDLVFAEGSVTLYCFEKSARERKKVGTLLTRPVATASGNVLMYDTNPDDLKKLDWSSIYLNSKNIIDNLIEAHLGTSAKITIGTFRFLYARPKDSSDVHRFECFYENRQWRVYDHGKGNG